MPNQSLHLTGRALSASRSTKFSQYETEVRRERQLAGIAKAKAEGKYKGRAPTARAKADKVRQLRNAGVRPAEIARQVGISRTSVYRVLG